MQPGTTDQILQRALALHGAGNGREAAGLYRKVLEVQPGNAEALHHLGLVHLGEGDAKRAVELMRRSVEIAPGDAFYWVNLGAAEKSAGDLSRARECYERALKLEPENAGAWTNLGNVHLKQEDYLRALDAYKRALRTRGDLIEAQSGKARALRELGRLEEAEAAARAAVESVKRGAAGNSGFDAYDVLGDALRDMGRIDEAIDAYREALWRQPRNVATLINLGLVLHLRKRLPEALEALRTAIALEPQRFEAHANLGNVLRDQGKLAETIEAYRRALAINPGATQVHSNLLYTMYYDPRFDTQALIEEHRAWARQHAEPVAGEARRARANRGYGNERSPDRRLRVGFVSADFREHPVGRFLIQLFAHRDRAAVGFVCFSDVVHGDEITRELRSNADQWHETPRMKDARLAEFIESQSIDILVDLTLHMANSRLLVFARRPAPVQVTYLGYPGTTGLEQLDYRITDLFLDPPGASESLYAERSVRLNSTYLCYPGDSKAPPVAELPALRNNGVVTFGCMNNFSKVSWDAMDTWARIMAQLPGSRIIIKANEGDHRRDVLARFERGGISNDRVEFVGTQPIDAYWATFNRIDIALDPFPYAGGTTTCDGLWMGVPAVTLAGESVVGRQGVSILNSAQMPEMIANDQEMYERLATDLARDLQKLSEVRHGLREKMKRSPLMDGKAFAREMERVFREMWLARLNSGA